MSSIEVERKYRPSKKRDRYYQAIIAAAELEFTHKGYGGASMQAIADRVGLPKANIHYYFHHKRKLYASVMQRALDLWCEQLSPLTAEADPATALDRYIRQHLLLAQAHPQTVRLVARELLQGAPAADQDLAEAWRLRLTADAVALQAWMARGMLPAVDPQQALTLLLAAVLGFASLATSGTPPEGQADAVADFISATLVRGFGLKASD